jgi:amidohydrolase
MGGEDMSFFLERVPGCYVFLGIKDTREAALHSPHFDFDESILSLGVELASRYAIQTLCSK